jgi:hypothetical protein
MTDTNKSIIPNTDVIIIAHFFSRNRFFLQESGGAAAGI